MAAVDRTHQPTPHPMLDLQIDGRKGQIADMIASVRDVPARVLPYAAATAMTRTAKIIATQAMPDAMRKAFDRPTPWALNSLAIEPATKDKLSAAVFVKNTAGGRAVPQERFLLPGVEGGPRSEKRVERSLRYSGLLASGERMYPARGLERDAFGNIPAPFLRSVVAWASAGGHKKAKRTKDAPASNPRGYYLFGKPGGVRGVAQRSGRIAIPLLIFTRVQPVYQARLDFAGVSEKVTVDTFAVELDRAAQQILARPR